MSRPYALVGMKVSILKILENAAKRLNENQRDTLWLPGRAPGHRAAPPRADFRAVEATAPRRSTAASTSPASTSRYLPTARSRVDELILQNDWTHRKPHTPKLVPIPTTATPHGAREDNAA